MVLVAMEAVVGPTDLGLLVAKIAAEKFPFTVAVVVAAMAVGACQDVRLRPEGGALGNEAANRHDSEPPHECGGDLYPALKTKGEHAFEVPFELVEPP